MPTEVGPCASAPLYFSAITPNASFQEAAVNWPFLSYWPFFLRSKGVVSRSALYMIFDRKYPLTQQSPRLIGESGSPCVTATRPF